MSKALTKALIPPTTPRQPTPAPGPGMYENVDPKEYHAWAAWNNSTLQQADGRTPRHMHDYLQQADEDPTPAKSLGTAIHTAILEPHTFSQRYVRRPADLNRKTNEGKAWWEELCQKYGADRILDEDAFETIQAAATAAWKHPTLGPVLKSAAGREVSLVWVDPETGLLCKGRYDLGSKDKAQMIDIKTTEDASPEAFSKSIDTYGYHMQAAHLLNGVKALGGSDLDYCLAAFEKSRPYEAAMYYLDQESIEIGQRHIRRLLTMTAECLAANRWPGYPPEYRTIGVPTWRKMQEEQTNAEPGTTIQ